MFTANDIAKVLEIVASQNKTEEELNDLAEKIGAKFPRKISLIQRALKRISDFDTREVTITSARELSHERKELIQTGIDQKFGCSHTYNYVVDQTIKAGLILKIGDLIIDNSVRSKVNQIKEHIINTAIN